MELSDQYTMDDKSDFLYKKHHSFRNDLAATTDAIIIQYVKQQIKHT